MPDHILKSILAVTFIFVQFIVIGFAFYEWKDHGGFQFDEAMDNALTIAPMTAVYAASMMRYVLYPPPRVSKKKRPIPYVILSLGLFALFAVALFFLASAKSNSGVTFEQYKKALAVADTVFGVYLSQIVASLFEGDREHQTQGAGN